MNKRAKRFTGIGLICLFAAFCLTAYNVWSDMSARAASQAALRQLDSEYQKRADAFQGWPDYVLDPEMEMPTQEIDGQRYIGTLRLESLGLTLPIISEWDYTRLRIAPCRYAGSAYLDNMVIAAHNYESHFGQLKNLSQGEKITFTDIDGNCFCYQVLDVEILSPYDVQEMTEGAWDLTLFTCTIGGQSRVTVRCERTDLPKNERVAKITG